MFQENLNYCNYEYDCKNAEDVIFQAYLFAFFRHRSYIYKLYNSGKICESQAIERISVASEKLKLMQKQLKSKVNIHNDDAKNLGFIVKPINCFCNSENQSAFWN